MIVNVPYLIDEVSLMTNDGSHLELHNGIFPIAFAQWANEYSVPHALLPRNFFYQTSWGSRLSSTTLSYRREKWHSQGLRSNVD